LNDIGQVMHTMIHARVTKGPKQWVTSLFDLTFAERKFGLSTYLSQKVKWFPWAKVLPGA